MTDTQQRISTIRDLPQRLRDLVSGLTPQQLTTVYVEGEWTIAQVVHHLLDAHTNSYQLFRRVLTEDNAGLSWPRQEPVAELPDARAADIEPSLLGLQGLHARWANMLDHIEDWSKQGASITSGKSYSLDALLTMYANHCDNHIHQIEALKAAMQ